MTKLHAAAALLALGSLAALPACSSRSDYSQSSSVAPMPAPQELSPSMVRQVQAALQQQNLYSGPVDGVWGPQTQSAVQSFQQSHSISATGQLNSQTIAALNLPANGGSNATADNSTKQSPGTVRQVQAALQQQGLYKGAVDGVWGPRTQGAVQSFQQSHSLNATGQLDSQTLAALNMLNNSGPSNTQSNAAPAPSQTNQGQTSQGQTSQGQMQSDGTMTNAPSSTAGNSTTPTQPGSTMQNNPNTAATSPGTPSSTATP